MNLGLIGLGRMGKAVAARAIKAGHKVTAYDPNQNARAEAEAIGVTIVQDALEVTNHARVIWLMVPAGDIVDGTIKSLLPGLKKDDIVIDGGNSNFENSVKRNNLLKEKGVFFLDCGTSGGLLGEEIGFSLMIGGDQEAFDKASPIFKAVAAEEGFAYMGKSGSGHYVKMVHNGIEYALLQSYAEGFHLLKEGQYKLDLHKVANVWNHGGVVRSWILSLLGDIFEEDQDLNDVSGSIDENKTGRWTYQEAEKKGIPVDLIKRSLEIRKISRETGGNYGTKLVAMLRNKFGGHPVKRK